jgi:hypothetical protein
LKKRKEKGKIKGKVKLKGEINARKTNKDYNCV